MNNTLRNPMLVHRIQDNLMMVNDFSLIGAAIIAYRGTAIKPLIKILYGENRPSVVAVIGEETMKMIEEYMTT